jgi:hypothetical protein
MLRATSGRTPLELEEQRAMARMLDTLRVRQQCKGCTGNPHRRRSGTAELSGTHVRPTRN